MTILFLLVMLLIASAAVAALVAIAAAAEGDLGPGCQVMGAAVSLIGLMGLLCGMAAIVRQAPPGGGPLEAPEWSEKYFDLTGVWIAPDVIPWLVGIFLLGLLVVYLLWQGRRN